MKRNGFKRKVIPTFRICHRESATTLLRSIVSSRQYVKIGTSCISTMLAAV